MLIIIIWIPFKQRETLQEYGVPSKRGLSFFVYGHEVEENHIDSTMWTFINICI